MTGSTINGWSKETPKKIGWSKNINAHDGVHIMNKNERKELSKIKRETGLTEEQIRKEKKYRKRLSEAQNTKGDKDDFDRRIINIVKSITKELKLPLEHPDTKKEIKKFLENNDRFVRLWFFPLVLKILLVVIKL